jgi:peptidyl-tRNA hydrolase
VESIIACLGGNKEVDRLKLGVGPDPGGDRRADYVLSTVPAADAELYELAISKSAQAAESWLDKGLTTTMNIYNGDVFGIPEGLRQQSGEGE